ncbi:hypothetical protein BP5796_02194 [Coleophoma crateriformis]|uniref:Enoyl reductase (ER) domain-containing protein n=1 Tax=Coleophoma crateriformis TaxID=565419 RepID=A0A3D8SXP1_9HELO|nr:hypothetical protein BP5796_02194 [Coleophoma crateriformis]
MMREAIVSLSPSLSTEIHEVEIPVPQSNEIVIKVMVAGSNVKDWAHLEAKRLSMNSGDDIAGYIHDLGENAKAAGEFRVGDRVAAFHPMLTPGGAYAEFAVAPLHTVFKLPSTITFEEAATIPLVAMTAGIALFHSQSLPPPWSPRMTTAAPLPLIVYGASSALGCFAIKLAKASNIHPIIAICGESKDYVASILEPSKGDTIVDYRHGTEAMKTAVKQALGPLEAHHALDAISAHGTWVPLTQILSPSGSQVSVVSGANAYNEKEIPEGVEIKYTFVGIAHTGAYAPQMPKQPAEKESARSAPEFAYVFFRYLARMLALNTFEGHPYEIIPGGLDGVAKGLQKLKNGEARGRKFIYRIGDSTSA